MRASQPSDPAREAISTSIRAAKVATPKQASNWALNLRNTQLKALRDLRERYGFRQSRHPFQKIQPSVQCRNFGFANFLSHNTYYCI
jgi:hypothetical protein